MTSVSVSVGTERVAERTVEMVVELRMLLMVPVPETTSLVRVAVAVTTTLEVAAGVVVTGVAAGNSEGSALLTSVGRAAYQEGVLPAEREDWSCETRAAGLAKANDWTDAGIAVARTPRRD